MSHRLLNRKYASALGIDFKIGKKWINQRLSEKDYERHDETSTIKHCKTLLNDHISKT